MEREGWRLLARMLEAQREARWNHLSDETAAMLAWPAFQKAVIAALEEHLARRGRTLDSLSGDTRDEPRSG